MEKIKRKWKNVHHTVRKPVVFIVGLLFILAAAATGWLPGPGGIPLFLIGIAILATEFVWAQTLRDWVLEWIKYFGERWREHKIIGTLIAVMAAAVAGFIGYFAYQKLH